MIELTDLAMLKLEPEQRCDSCRSAPCAFYCRADAAALCAACDADVHSANLLARRHRRVHMGAVAAPAGSGAFVVWPGVNSSSWPIREGRRCDDYDGGEEEEEATSWLLLDPLKGAEEGLVADFLDLGGTTGEMAKELVVPGEPEQRCYDAQNSKRGYGATLPHSVLMSSSPDNSTVVQDITSPYYLRRTESAMDLFSAAGPSVSTHMDREARVHRYREKRKMRRFDKTIRYSSRKAYAETRPRIKGRFAKRADADLEVDHYFSAAALSDSICGIVPTF